MIYIINKKSTIYNFCGKELPYLGQQLYTMYRHIKQNNNNVIIINEEYEIRDIFTSEFKTQNNVKNIFFLMFHPYNYDSNKYFIRKIKEISLRNVYIVGFCIGAFSKHLINIKDLSCPVIDNWPEKTSLKIIEYIKRNNPLQEDLKGYISSLNSFPLTETKWKGINIAEYYNDFEKEKEYFAVNPDVSSVSLFTQRGCPYQCIYCSYNSFIYQKRNYSEIEQDFLDIKNRIKINHVNILDPTFNTSVSHVKKICEIISKCAPGIKWWADCRIKKDLPIEILAKSGMKVISFGIETGSKRLQKLLKKNLRLELIDDIFSQLYRNGIKINVLLMVGIPTETDEDVLKTKKIVQISNKYNASVTVTPQYIIPGTQLSNLAEKYILDPNNRGEYGSNPFFSTSIIQSRINFIKKNESRNIFNKIRTYLLK